MKKRIALGLALALAASVGTTAFAAAANPFTDVPAKHWAYGAIQQLSKAGIVEGYNDGTFKGDKTITRYEMAVIVAKAMAKENQATVAQKAIIDKLAAEFASELDNLGVRVSKLEANQSNIKFTADARLRYDNTAGSSATPDRSYSGFKDRFRLNMNATINDDTSVYARYVFMDQSAFNALATTTTSANRISDLAFTTKGFLGGSTAVTLGRYSLNMGPTTFLSGTTGGMEGIQTNTKVGNANLMLGYMNASYYLGTQSQSGLGNASTAALKADWAPSGATAGSGVQIKNVGVAEFDYNFAPNVAINVDYFANQSAAGVPKLYEITGGGLTYGLGANWKVIGEYYKNDASGAKALSADGSAPTATIARIAYKGAQAAVPGTWGAFAEYTKFEANSMPAELEGPYTKMNNYSVGGLKSYDVNVNYTLAKNVTIEGVYQFNMKDIVTNQAPLGGDKFTRVNLNYFF